MRRLSQWDVITDVQDHVMMGVQQHVLVFVPAAHHRAMRQIAIIHVPEHVKQHVPVHVIERAPEDALDQVDIKITQSVWHPLQWTAVRIGTEHYNL